MAVKRRKIEPSSSASGQRHSGRVISSRRHLEALPVTGMAKCGLSAGGIKKALQTNKSQLVEEYVAIMNLGPTDKDSADSLFPDAVRYMLKLILQDLRPPWLTHHFPQAVPGASVLSRFTRPTFLQWSADRVKVLFGEAVASLLRETANEVSVELSGVLARPLYVCTTQRPGKKLCMALASMSPLLTQVASRKQYLCEQ